MGLIREAMLCDWVSCAYRTVAYLISTMWTQRLEGRKKEDRYVVGVDLAARSNTVTKSLLVRYKY